MLEALTTILELQEPDMQMLQLMKLRREHQRELDKIRSTKENLNAQVELKEHEIMEQKKNIRLLEGELNETTAKFKRLETQQHSIKKVEEFNALNQEMAQVERERINREQRLSELYDKLAADEETLKTLQKALHDTVDNNKALEQEIHESILRINEEGRILKAQRDKMAVHADPEVLRIYERLLNNKRDRVVVPIENRCCSGCHIMLTAQDENMVRKGEHLVFCEHCSRILYWQESEALEGTAVATKTRRRKKT